MEVLQCCMRIIFIIVTVTWLFTMDVTSPGGLVLKYKKVGVLVIWLWGVNFRFWSCLGC